MDEECHVFQRPLFGKRCVRCFKREDEHAESDVSNTANPASSQVNERLEAKPQVATMAKPGDFAAKRAVVAEDISKFTERFHSGSLHSPKATGSVAEQSKTTSAASDKAATYMTHQFTGRQAHDREHQPGEDGGGVHESRINNNSTVGIDKELG